jgi:hypothetical protein
VGPRAGFDAIIQPVAQRYTTELSQLLNQLRNKAKEYESFSLAPEGSNDTSDTAQLLIVIPGKREYFEVVE